MSARNLEPYRQADFVRLLLADSRSSARRFQTPTDSLHLQMHAFTRLMQQAKGAADWGVYKRGVHLAAELWARPDAD